jgi:hypothetical protein
VKRQLQIFKVAAVPSENVTTEEKQLLDCRSSG